MNDFTCRGFTIPLNPLFDFIRENINLIEDNVEARKEPEADEEVPT